MHNLLLTCLIFDKDPDFFGMMDAAVVEDKNTLWSRIRICERDLCKISKPIGMDKPTLTTCSSRNLMKCWNPQQYCVPQYCPV